MPNYSGPQDRYSSGYNRILHRGKTVTTVVGDQKYEALVKNIKNYSFKVGYIPAGYEHRPDLISNLFYGTPAYWWLLMETNNLDDSFEGLNVNDRILIPEVR